ncbi:hypothetical protein GUJ93_ZPchr0011g27271 [Zizania palustris]|uniref:Uncharacterized protein n=1 Tax=Zizania palustris TaxID=103762 RepID=A0A8J5WJ27_ZIZPA|nr:hypothetical protein GUJ93_ZPchr0011g27271 [Zizania palustris]
MCPLRVILIFLSATIAGFFLIRGLNAEPDPDLLHDDDGGSDSPRTAAPLHSKVGSAMRTGFWTVVDMASGNRGQQHHCLTKPCLCNLLLLLFPMPLPCQFHHFLVLAPPTHTAAACLTALALLSHQSSSSSSRLQGTLEIFSALDGCLFVFNTLHTNSTSHSSVSVMAMTMLDSSFLLKSSGM